jgi:hypothetical protein
MAFVRTVCVVVTSLAQEALCCGWPAVPFANMYGGLEIQLEPMRI